MMNRYLTLAVGLCMALPVAAQKSGMINNNAPQVKQSITAGDAKIQLDYTSIAWGQGQAFNAAMDKGGGKARERINDLAKNQPIGSFNTSVDLMCGETKIPAGEYKLGFTITDNMEWQMTFMGKDTINVKLPLVDSKEHSSNMLVCSLFAAERGSVGCYVAFGAKSCMITFTAGGGAGGGKKG
jgi:hypothetical protein